jgi:hypothetical protein
VTAEYYAIDVLFAVDCMDRIQAARLWLPELISGFSQLVSRQSHTIRIFHWVSRIFLLIISAVYY